MFTNSNSAVMTGMNNRYCTIFFSRLSRAYLVIFLTCKIQMGKFRLFLLFRLTLNNV